jgi:hypothetical protein
MDRTARAGSDGSSFYSKCPETDRRQRNRMNEVRYAFQE